LNYLSSIDSYFKLEIIITKKFQWDNDKVEYYEMQLKKDIIIWVMELENPVT